MLTTIEISDPLLERAKRYAAEQGKPLAEVVNDALLEKLGRNERPAPAAEPFRLLTFGAGGVQPGIDLHSNADLTRATDEEFRDPATGTFDLDKMR